MPLPIINSIASWVLKQRIHQIELFLKYPNEVQEELLMNLIRSSENTAIGKVYEYSSIKSYQTFTERVPIYTYENLEPLIEQTRGDSDIPGRYQGFRLTAWQSIKRFFVKSRRWQRRWAVVRLYGSRVL